jgi:hypothetical protein
LEKRREKRRKKGKREREPIVEMREGKKKKKIKKWEPNTIFLFNESYRELLEHHFCILALHIPK